MNDINKNELRKILSYEGVEELISNEKWEELFNRLVIKDVDTLFNALQQTGIYPFTLAPEDFPWDYFVEQLRGVKRGFTTGIFTQSFNQFNDAYTFDILTNIAKLGQVLGIKYIYKTDWGFDGNPDYLFSDRPIEGLLHTTDWKDEDYVPEDFERIIFGDI